MSSHLPYKDFEESPEFTAHSREIEKDHRLLDEVMWQVQRAIQNNPKLFRFASEKAGIRAIDSVSFRGYPSVTILFKEYKDKYVLLDIFVNDM